MLPVWEKQHLFRPTKRRWRGCRVSPLLILPLLACGCITFTLLRVLLESSAEPEDAARPDREVPLPPSLPLSAMTHSDALAAMYAASALGAARSAAQAAQACGQGAIRYTLLAVADQDERAVNHSSGAPSVREPQPRECGISAALACSVGELVSSLLRGTLCDGRDSGGSLSARGWPLLFLPRCAAQSAPLLRAGDVGRRCAAAVAPRGVGAWDGAVDPHLVWRPLALVRRPDRCHRRIPTPAAASRHTRWWGDEQGGVTSRAVSQAGRCGQGSSTRSRRGRRGRATSLRARPPPPTSSASGLR